MALTHGVVDAIKQMILTGDLSPGDRLPVEKDLAAQLGISRGSLREGVRALTVMGVLDTRQGDGTYVTSLNADRLFAPVSFAVDVKQQDSLHFLAVRRLLETEAAGLAATRVSHEALAHARRILDSTEVMLADGVVDGEALLAADRAFHRVIAEAAGNPVLAALLDAVSGQTWRARLWRSVGQEGSWRRSMDEHRAVLAALAARDADRARLRMAVHLMGLEDFVRGDCEQGD